MSQVRAYLSECLLWAVWETLLELPIRLRELPVEVVHGSHEPSFYPHS
jgi:hypothetical protein